MIQVKYTLYALFSSRQLCEVGRAERDWAKITYLAFIPKGLELSVSQFLAWCFNH